MKLAESKKPSDLLSEMGTRVVRARQSIGKSREEMARLMGMTPTTYESVERGRRRSTLEEVSKLAGILSMDPEELVGDAPLTTLEERIRNTPKSVLTRNEQALINTNLNVSKSSLGVNPTPVMTIHGLDINSKEKTYNISVFGELTESEVKELAGHLAMYRLRNNEM